jgi:hypothetical protein
MKKKIVGLTLLMLCIFLFAVVGQLSCPVKAEASNDQVLGFQITLRSDLINGNTSIIEPLGPGSGGGRGPPLLSSDEAL